MRTWGDVIDEATRTQEAIDLIEGEIANGRDLKFLFEVFASDDGSPVIDVTVKEKGNEIDSEIGCETFAEALWAAARILTEE